MLYQLRLIKIDAGGALASMRGFSPQIYFLLPHSENLPCHKLWFLLWNRSVICCEHEHPFHFLDLAWPLEWATVLLSSSDFLATPYASTLAARRRAPAACAKRPRRAWPGCWRDGEGGRRPGPIAVMIVVPNITLISPSWLKNE
jgi:hypothetical protein